MKKIILLATLTLISAVMYTGHAQETGTQSREDRKTQREAERARQKAEEKKMEAAMYEEAVKAINNRQFVLEADQVMFKRGETAYVTTNTNFTMVNDDCGTVQVAFNVPMAGPNGIGGVTVDGIISGFEIKTSRKGNITCKFSIQGIGISAQIFVDMAHGSNKATVTITPNFNSRNMRLRGRIIPLEQSTVYKGRSL